MARELREPPLVRCRECDGAGYVEQHDEEGFFHTECPACEGAGYFIDHQGGEPAFEPEEASNG